MAPGAPAESKKADYSKKAIVLQLHTHRKPVREKLEAIKANLRIKKEEKKLSEDGVEMLTLLIHAEPEDADNNPRLFFEQPTKISDRKPNLNRITECEEFPAGTYYARLKDAGPLGTKILNSLGGDIRLFCKQFWKGGGPQLSSTVPLCTSIPTEQSFL